MIRKSSNFLLGVVLCAAAHAATTSVTLKVVATGNVSASTGNFVFTGTADMPPFASGGVFSATLPASALVQSTATIPYTFTFGANTLAGVITIPNVAVILGGNQGTASGTITSGTGTYAGATGSFPTLTGSGGLTSTGSISLTFSGPGTITTSGSGGGGTTTPTPVITALQNNYSYILPGLPNYGIAPGTLFIIKGTNLNNSPISALQSSAAPGLPKTLSGTSVSVTVNGTTTNPVFYYSSPTQLGMVLPSSTPVGTGTITVTNSGTPSAPFPIQVVQSAFGIDTLYGSGTGAGVATDANYNIFTAASSASPGQAIILWGSGVGADTANDDATYPLKQDNLTNIPLTVYIGGVSAAVAYRGRSQYPGVDQVVVTIPASVLPGCNVSIVTVSGSVVSNYVTIPVSQNGGACTDPTSVTGGSTSINLGGKSSVNFGFVAVTQDISAGLTPTAPTTTTNSAAAIFENVSGTQFAASANTNSASIGSCVVNAATLGSIGSIPTFTGLDAGTITVNTPVSGTLTLQTVPGFLGFYSGQLAASAIPTSGGTFTFNGGGGKNIGSFTAAVNFPAPLVWTNMSSITSVSRANGVTVNWTGGGTGTYVSITGGSSATIAGQTTSVTFTCTAQVSAGTFTVPPAVLLALPAGTGSLSVGNSTNPQTFTASGLDLGYIYAGVTAGISPTYN